MADRLGIGDGASLWGVKAKLGSKPLDLNPHFLGAHLMGDLDNLEEIVGVRRQGEGGQFVGGRGQIQREVSVTSMLPFGELLLKEIV